MKRLILILVFTLFSCSTEQVEQTQEEQTCYRILSKGFDSRGNFIIIKYNDEQRRYQVEDYQYYIGRNEICDLSNLTQQPL